MAGEYLDRIALQLLNDPFCKGVKVDIQLLNLWFKKGYSNREMAWFLLLAEVQHGHYRHTTDDFAAEDTEKRWAELHVEVCKIIYQK